MELRRFFTIIRVYFLILLLSSCATVNYDQQADQQLATISQEINLQLISWAHQADTEPSNPVVFDDNFYNKVEADLTTLEIRMEASQDPATQKLIMIFDSLISQFEALRTLHKKQNKLSSKFVHAELNLINSQIAALTTFELSLKGSQQGSTSTTQSTSSTNAINKVNSTNSEKIIKDATIGGN